MLRGVNKSIIEILETENQYFEKVILFVRPNHLEKDKVFLDKKAKEYVNEVNLKPVLPGDKPVTTAKSSPLMYSIVKFGSAAAAGGALVALLLRM